MEFIYTDGRNSDFIELCHLLDNQLNESVGSVEKQSQYNQYNTLNDIHDVVLAYEASEPIGCVSYKLHSERIAEVKRVFIKKRYRGRGIAKQLMLLLEEHAREKQINTFILETGKPLTAAINLYQKLEYGVIDNFDPYKNMPNSICMQKSICGV